MKFAGGLSWHQMQECVVERVTDALAAYEGQPKHQVRVVMETLTEVMLMQLTHPDVTKRSVSMGYWGVLRTQAWVKSNKDIVWSVKSQRASGLAENVRSVLGKPTEEEAAAEFATRKFRARRIDKRELTAAAPPL